MKLRVIFLTKKNIYYLLLIILTLSITLLIYLSHKKSIETFTTVDQSQVIQQDITGDGNNDVLYIKKENGEYYIQINSKDKSFSLDPNSTLNTLGNYYNYWPMRLTLMDISRNNSLEIFTQASTKNEPIQHVFTWNNNKFNDIFCSSNNILGFIDSKNNKTPKLISGKIINNNIDFHNYIFAKNSLKYYQDNFIDNFMGKDTILSFINLMNTFPTNDDPLIKNIFHPKLSDKSSYILYSLYNNNIKYVFQDALFKDISWYQNGNPSQVLWSLNFKASPLYNTNNMKNYTLNVKLNLVDKNDSSSFKIISIDLKQ